MEVAEFGQLIGEHRTPGARIDPRIEHRVIGDQLPATVEQLQECDLTVGSVEAVIRVELDHREPSPTCCEFVASTRLGLLVGQQLGAGLLPFVG